MAERSFGGIALRAGVWSVLELLFAEFFGSHYSIMLKWRSLAAATT